MGGELIGTKGGEDPATTAIEEQGNELKKRYSSYYLCLYCYKNIHFNVHNVKPANEALDLLNPLMFTTQISELKPQLKR
ncbi:hypothetical protein V6N11_036067 [Hibiscus sabdariffa]|uniref:Uncharacterized protein n=1 Tax=Hibiscus sabdariffa TaxID=183260 RepID=A0ABR2R995_9ROSI